MIEISSVHFSTWNLPCLSQNEFLKLPQLKNTLFFQKIEKGWNFCQILKMSMPCCWSTQFTIFMQIPGFWVLPVSSNTLAIGFCHFSIPSCIIREDIDKFIFTSKLVYGRSKVFFLFSNSWLRSAQCIFYLDSSMLEPEWIF